MMGKSLEEIVAELQRDIDNWEAEVRQLQVDGHDEQAAKVQHWVNAATRLLTHFQASEAGL